MVDEPGVPTGPRGTGVIECRYYGRDFTAHEMELLRSLITQHPTRAAIARAFCRETGWYKPDGSLKDMTARVALLAMHRDALITLPPPQHRVNRSGPIVFGPDTEPPPIPPPTTLDEVRPLAVSIVTGGKRQGKLWNEFVDRHHYLGHTRLVGAQMRYAIHDRNGAPVAMLGFSTAAWKIAPRDTFIGWTSEQRQKNLPLVVDPRLFDHVLSFPSPTLGPTSSLSCGADCPMTGPDAATSPRSSSKPSSRHRATQAPSTRPQGGSVSEASRDEAVTSCRGSGAGAAVRAGRDQASARTSEHE